MVRTATRLRDEGSGVAVADLTALGENLTAGQWYGGMLSKMGMQLGLEEELLEFWEVQGQTRAPSQHSPSHSTQLRPDSQPFRGSFRLSFTPWLSDGSKQPSQVEWRRIAQLLAHEAGFRKTQIESPGGMK